MKLSLILLIFFAIGCKPQEKSQQEPSVPLPALADYTPNPDEVVLFLTLVTTEKSQTGWLSTVEVKKQVRAGFGFKNRLAPGQKIALQSKEEIPSGNFYCAADYKIAPGGGTYILKSFLRK